MIWILVLFWISPTQVFAALEAANETQPEVLSKTAQPEALSKKAQRAARKAELRKQVDTLLQRDPQKSDYVDEKKCISSSRIREVEVLDDRHVTFRVGKDSYYLVQFKNRCPGLRRGKPIMYESSSHRLCVHDTVRAIYEYGIGQLEPGMRCFIPGFQSVTREQVDGIKQLLKRRPKTS